MSRSCKLASYISVGLLVLAIFSIFQPVVVKASPNLLVGRQMYSSGYPASTYAAKSDMWIGHFGDLYMVPQIHSLNPNVLCLLYRNVRTVWGPGSYEYVASEYNTFVNNGWILKDSSGNFVVSEEFTGFAIDIGNLGYQSWLANWVSYYISSYGANGVYFDWLFTDTIIFHGASATSINPRTGKAWTNAEVETAIINLVDTVKNNIGLKLVVGNSAYDSYAFYNPERRQGILNLMANSKIDGVHSEAWLSAWSQSNWYSETEWLNAVNMAVEINNNFLSKGNKIFVTTSENAGLWIPPGQVVLPAGVTDRQYYLYVYASMLLAASYSGNYMNLGYYTPQDYPQSLFAIDIGSPTGVYRMISGTYVYERDFSNGKVYVNPTSNSYQVVFSGSYLDSNGNSVSSPLTIQPHTGVILTASTSPTPPPVSSGTQFGQTVKGAGIAAQPASVMVGSRFASSSGGTASSVSVYISRSGGSSGVVKCAIYRESDRVLLGVTEEVVVPGGFSGWQALSFSNGPVLTAGTSYSLVVWFGGSGFVIYYAAGTSAQSWYASQAYGVFPNGPYSSLGGFGQESTVYSIYCTLSS